MAKEKKKHISEATLDGQNAHGKLQSIATNFGPRINANTASILTPYLKEGQTLPDPTVYFDLGLQHLSYLRSQMDTTDNTRIGGKIDQFFAKKEVEKKRSDLNKRIRFTLVTAENCHGKAGLKALPFRAEDAKTNRGLLTQAKILKERLLAFNLPQPTGDAESSALNVMPPTNVLAQSLDSRITDFERALLALDVENKERHAVQVDQRTRVEVFNDFERRLRGLMKAFMVFAELDDLARDLRLPRTTSRTISDDPPTSDGTPPLAQAA